MDVYRVDFTNKIAPASVHESSGRLTNSERGTIIAALHSHWNDLYELHAPAGQLRMVEQLCLHVANPTIDFVVVEEEG